MKGFINVDLYGNPDQRVDLFKFPWPWKTKSVDYIYCHSFLEHVQSFRATWRECYRILKVGGKFLVNVPHARGVGAFWPDQHKYYFDISAFMNFEQCYEYDIPEAKFKTVSLRHKFGPKMRVLSPLANINPLAWDYLNMPVQEIEWIGVKIK